VLALSFLSDGQSLGGTNKTCHPALLASGKSFASRAHRSPMQSVAAAAMKAAADRSAADGVQSRGADTDGASVTGKNFSKV
jgi:hypothetical protein